MTAITERGNSFLTTMMGGLTYIPPEVLHGRESKGMPLVISRLKLLASYPGLDQFPTVFLAGRVYRTIHTEKLVDEYKDLDPWRDTVRALVRGAGLLPFDGLAMDLHSRNVRAGAGRAFLHASLCRTGILEGQGRIGLASIEEAQFILAGGGNVGLVVNESEYEQAVAYLSSKTTLIPNALPSAYFGLLDLEASDIICGYGDIQRWLKEQVGGITNRQFRKRLLFRDTFALMDYYATYYARSRPGDMQSYLELEERIRTTTALSAK